MEECFLSNKVTLIRPNGGTFTPRETDVISCIINGGTEKSIGRLLGISHHTAGNYIGNIRGVLGFGSKEKIIKFVEKSGKYRQLNERYIDLLLFNEFQETLEKIKTLKNSSQKYKCVVHANVEEANKYILLDYLKLGGVKVDILYKSTDYADDKFHVLCCSESCEVDLENLNDNIVISENHCNNIITLTGKCIESYEAGTQYKAYFSLLGCISKIYSSKEVDGILNEFKEYYHNMKDGVPSKSLERNQIEISDKRKSKYVMLSFITLIILLIVSSIMYLSRHNAYKSVLVTNINILIGQEVFLKRKDLTSEMDKILSKQKGVKFLVLVGQGGAGKTTLARHYVHINDAKIKWEINAATEESSIKSFLALAIELSQKQRKDREELQYIQAIEDPEAKKQRLISFVFYQLKEINNWILLFDNVDDFKMVRAFIPSNKDSCGEGAVIITTRNANCENMSFISDKSLNIEYLEKIEKKELFCSILYGEKRKPLKDEIEKIDKFLENIPSMLLDITNAAYYIKSTNSSFEKYLEIIKSPSEELNELQSKFLEQGIDYDRTRYKMTLAIFNQLIEMSPKFKELLLFICLLDSQNIPIKYLEQFRGYAIVHTFLCNLKRFFSITVKNGAFSIHKSIQEIGLVHLMGLLTNAEKEAFFKNIINIMTPYSSILWQKYKTYPRKLEKSDLDELEVHVKSMINALKTFNLPILEKNKYVTKLLLTIGFIYGEDNFHQAKYFLSEALEHNGNNGYIADYEYAIALLALGYAHFYLDELENAKLWLDKGLEFCKKLNGTEILRAYGLCDLGKYYAKTNKFSKAILLLEKALSIVDDNQESWARSTASQICWGLSHAYADHYISKSDGYKTIAYAEKSLEKLGFENYLHNKNKDIKKPEDDSLGDCYWCLAKAYNRVGEYDNAQKCADYYYHLYEKYFKSDDHISDKVHVDIDNGYTLLRKGELKSALNVLDRAISKKEELKDNYYLFYALVSRTEALIRLNKLDEAYSDFQYAISKKGNSTDNYNRLLICICFYHAFVIKYKQKDYKLALSHFSNFCSSIKEFCKSFLSVSEYSKLLDANVFEIIADESQIATCLQNSLKIFSYIYGNDHPFVKEYIIRSLN